MIESLRRQRSISEETNVCPTFVSQIMIKRGHTANLCTWDSSNICVG